MKVKAVLFDLFDTLLLIKKGEEFYEPSLRKLHENLVKNGIETDFENFKRVYFEVRDELYAKSAETLEEPHFNTRISQTLNRLGYNYSASSKVAAEATDAFAKEFACYVCLDDDTLDVLQKLHGKYRLGMVSNFAIPDCVRNLLDKFDLKKFFAIIVISGDINRRKPSPEIFQRALRKLKVCPSEAVFVGDTPSMDIKGAKAVAMKSILIRRKTTLTDAPNTVVWKPPENDVKHNPDRVIKRLRELPDILEDC
ncbi:HAD family hydrolase [Candidatus Bathyarchaeota archaeon]|nr:HAD family hydrolase [Candidatus Bathyarchaeota archaeon]